MSNQRPNHLKHYLFLGEDKALNNISFCLFFLPFIIPVYRIVYNFCYHCQIKSKFIVLGETIQLSGAFIEIYLHEVIFCQNVFLLKYSTSIITFTIPKQ